MIASCNNDVSAEAVQRQCRHRTVNFVNRPCSPYPRRPTPYTRFSHLPTGATIRVTQDRRRNDERHCQYAPASSWQVSAVFQAPSPDFRAIVLEFQLPLYRVVLCVKADG